MMLKSRCQLGFQSSEGFSKAGKSTSNVAYSDTWQINTDCWQKASVPHHKKLSTGLL